MNTPEHWLQQAAAARKAGQGAQAKALLRRVLAQQPHHPAAHYQMSLVQIQEGRYQDAASSLRTVLAHDETSVDALSTLATVLVSLSRPEEAEPLLRRAAALRPDFAAAHENLAVLLVQAGRWAEAVDSFQRVLSLNPGSMQAAFGLGLCWENLHHPDLAADCYRAVLSAAPTHVEALHHLGVCLLALARPDEAIACQQQALRLQPDHIPAMNDLANCLRAKKRDADALQVLERALRLRPGQADLHVNRAHVWLSQGNFAQGWTEYEWRFWAGGGPKLQTPCPRWDGSPLDGKRLFVYAEQGFGDSFQFVRYLPLVRAQAAEVIFECKRGMKNVLASCAGFDQIAEPPEEGDASPACDLSVPLLSLPALLGTTLETVPAQIPYIFPTPQKIGQWQARLREMGLIPLENGKAGRPLTVGIVWAGSRLYSENPDRSVLLAHFAPLAGIPGVSFVSLQKGPSASEAAAPPPGMFLHDLGPELEDFADTAAVIAHLDLVITVDTSLAHLTGALGRPVWVALPYIAEWRWLAERDDSPWYPTMRLFRQDTPRDWPAVFVRIAEALRQKSREMAGNTP